TRSAPRAAPRGGARAAAAPESQEEAEQIRRAHLGHESSIRTLGALHLIGFGGYLVGLGVLAYQVIRDGKVPGTPVEVAAFLALVTLALSIMLALGLGLRRLRPWARWVEAVLIVVFNVPNLIMVLVGANSVGEGLLVALLGSLIPAYLLYLLLSPKGRMVFSPEYRAIIERTPDVRFRSGCGSALLLLAILLAVIIVIVAFGVLG
ncbi:MAG: hypothetical protein K2X91_02675, partial [Thermoleophilia bacterium]|nr:hypothetical protein [Thermoleophilia bacterium]